MMTKYLVGDWVKGNGPDIFWRITEITLYVDGVERYSVAFMLANHEISKEFPDFGGFRHFGDRSGVEENELISISDPKDILLCRMAELHEQYLNVSRSAAKLKMDILSIIRTRELLISEDE